MLYKNNVSSRRFRKTFSTRSLSWSALSFKIKLLLTYKRKTKAYLEPYQTSKIERFAKIVYNGATLGHSLIEKEDQKNKYKLTKIDKIR